MKKVHKVNGNPSDRRRPRFKRSNPPPLRLTEDDLVILGHVAEHRFLRSTHLGQLLDRSHDKIVRRLAALYHNGFLDRPRAQLDFFARAGSAPLIYGLGNRGALVEGAAGIDWTGKNRDVKRPYIEHALMVADFMITLECAVRRNPLVRLLRAQDIAIAVRSSNGLAIQAWTMTARLPDSNSEIAVTPDKVFGLEFVATGLRNYFLLEADRSTMPIERPSLEQSSFKKKLLAYHYGHMAKQHATLWGIPGFRVLTIAKSAERIASMIEAVQAITGGKGSNVFLFADSGALKGSDPLTHAWLSGKANCINLIGEPR